MEAFNTVIYLDRYWGTFLSEYNLQLKGGNLGCTSDVLSGGEDLGMEAEWLLLGRWCDR